MCWTHPRFTFIEFTAQEESSMFSIVIPLFNEEESLTKLVEEIDQVAKEHDYDFEVIFVDDGSTDGSWQVIEEMSQQDARVIGIQFRRNFGKAAALSAGFSQSRGDLVFTMDADLQDDATEIPKFLDAMDKDLDVVSGWKKVRHDPWHKVGPSRIFNRLVGWLTGVKLHDHNCGFKCYRREIFDEVDLYGELHRFVPVLAAARGWRVGEVVVNHRSRQFGQSKYGFKRFIKGFLDLLTVYFLTGFNRRPQHLLGTIGAMSFFVGIVGLGYLAIYWMVRQLFIPDLEPLHQRPAVLYSLGALIVGAQFTSIGFLAELITAHNTRSSDTYAIRKCTRPMTESASSPSDSP
jgi:dolichol-phosphate mannosyltransferase